MDELLEYWTDMVEGKEPDVTEFPQWGYWRGSWFKDSGLLPIATWVDEDTGDVVCLVGYSEACGRLPTAFFAKPETLMDRWTFFCRNALEYEIYERAFETGADWPEQVRVEDESRHEVGGNQPPSDVDILKTTVNAVTKAVAAHLAIEPALQDIAWADKAANYRSELLKIKKSGEAERMTKQKPHDDALATVRLAYKPIINFLDDWNKKIRTSLAAFKDREDAAEKARMLSEAQAVNDGEKSIDDVEFSKPLTSAGGKAKTGVGRATGFGEKRTAVIDDYEAALAHFGQNPQVKVVIQALANQVARNGADSGPGWSVKIETVAN